MKISHVLIRLGLVGVISYCALDTAAHFRRSDGARRYIRRLSAAARARSRRSGSSRNEGPATNFIKIV